MQGPIFILETKVWAPQGPFQGGTWTSIAAGGASQGTRSTPWKVNPLCASPEHSLARPCPSPKPGGGRPGPCL